MKNKASDEQPKHKYYVELFRTLKKVKNMDKLKIIKRLKSAKESLEASDSTEDKKKHEEEVEIIELEIQVLKCLESEILAKKLICRMINKDKNLIQNEQLLNYQRENQDLFEYPALEEEKKELETVFQKVTNRIASQKNVSETLDKIKQFILVDLGFKEKEEVILKKKVSIKKKMDQVEKESEVKVKKPRKKEVKIKNELFVERLGDMGDGDFNQIYGVQGKNRMGQRQRRMFNEKKYGGKAKHLQVKEKVERSVQKFERKKRKPEKLHPSWEAKRNQKLSISEVKPAGKKIVFE